MASRQSVLNPIPRNAPTSQLLPVRSLSALQTSRDGGTSAGGRAVPARLSPGPEPAAPAPPASAGPAAAPYPRFHTFRFASLFEGLKLREKPDQTDKPRLPRFVFVWKQRAGDQAPQDSSTLSGTFQPNRTPLHHLLPDFPTGAVE